jgi:hypothetical protein
VWAPDKKELFNVQTLQNGLLASVASKTRGEEVFLAPLIAEVRCFTVRLDLFALMNKFTE